jgi:hypothetical protein
MQKAKANTWRARCAEAMAAKKTSLPPLTAKKSKPNA